MEAFMKTVIFHHEARPGAFGALRWLSQYFWSFTFALLLASAPETSSAQVAQFFSVNTIWSIPQGSRPYVTNAPGEIGLANNPVTGHVLVMRFPKDAIDLIFAILDAESGD